jgi:hypothetical protein
MKKNLLLFIAVITPIVWWYIGSLAWSYALKNGTYVGLAFACIIGCGLSLFSIFYTHDKIKH